VNKEILRLAIPNIISNLTVPLLGMVDMALMGRMGSPVYIGAIALGGIIFSVVYMGFGFLRMGTTGFTAQAYGRGNTLQIGYALYRALTIALLIALLLIVLQKQLGWFSFFLLDGSEEVKSLASTYFLIRIWAAPATLGLYAFMGWFVGMQNTLIPMYIAIAINLLNIAFNLIFVVWLGMDVDGVAWGTVLAQYSGLLLAIGFYLKKYSKYRIKLSLPLLIEKSELQRFFKVNADILIRTMLLILTLSFFTSKSAGIGDEVLAINSIILQFFFLFSYFMDGFAYAGEALTGKFIGSGNKQKLIKLIKHIFAWGLSLSLPFMLLYAFIPSLLIGLITNDVNLIDSSKPFHVWMLLIPVTTFGAFIWDGIFVGATASTAMRNSMLIAVLLVFFPAWMLLNNVWENHGLWIAFHLFMLSRAVTMSLMARKAVLGVVKN
jgi:multidrug resistance protein, MATE family